MDIQGDMQITLVIKAPNQRMEDQTVDCMLGWTIQKLKHHLESVYPSKPKHHEQRLIYSGKLLQDHLTLKEILKQYDCDVASNTHTVHLVCSNSSSPKATSSTPNSSPSQRAKETTSPHSPVPTTPVSQSTSSSDLPPQAHSSSSSQAPATEILGPSPPNGDGIRYRGAGQSPQQNSPGPSMYPSFPGYQQYPPNSMFGTPPTGQPYTPEQYAWLVQQQQQQAYSQYMMQYMQYYQQNLYGGAGMMGAAGPAGQPFMPYFMPGTTPPPTPTTSTPPQPLQQQPPGAGEAAAAAAPPPPAQHQQQQQRGNNNNVRMNAQGGVDEDDEDERDPRDWLHHTYFIMRFITFVGIIVFYSSFSRFLMVMAGFLVIYFFQKVRVAREQSVRQQQQEQQQREEEERQQQQQEEGNGGTDPQAQGAQEDSNTEEANGSPAAADVADGPTTREQQDQSEGDAATTDTGAGSEQEGGEQQAEEEDGNKVKRALYFVYKTVESFFSSLVPVPPELMEAN